MCVESDWRVWKSHERQLLALLWFLQLLVASRSPLRPEIAPSPAVALTVVSRLQPSLTLDLDQSVLDGGGRGGRGVDRRRRSRRLPWQRR